MTEIRAKTRISWVDACKAIGILLVIAGHNMHHVPLYALIYSFHMPLFFILSALTLRPSKSFSGFAKRAAKSFLQLVVPAVAVFLVSETLSRLLRAKPILTLDYAKQLFRSLLFCNGMVATYHEVIVEPIGVCWFLIVLFCARTLFDGLALAVKKRSLLYTLCFVLGILGVLMKGKAFSFTATTGSIVDGKLIPQAEVWPFAVDVTLAVMPFLAVGQLLKQNNTWFEKPKAKPVLLLSTIVWLSGFCVIWFLEAKNGNYFDIICRRYPLFPLCTITAVAGSAALMALCALLPRGRVYGLLERLGTKTLPLLMIHKLDFLWEFLWKWTTLDVIAIPIRIGSDLLLLMLYLFLKKKLFKAKPEDASKPIVC